MYFISFECNNRKQGGILLPDGTHVISLSDAGKLSGQDLPETLPAFINTADDAVIDRLRSALKTGTPECALPVSDLKILAPIPEPGRNIICVGKNYADHVGEIKSAGGSGTVPEKPIYFSKLTTCVVGPDAPVQSHRGITAEADYEAELAVIIGKGGSNIPVDEAEQHIFGYTCANDVTARDIQRERGQWFAGKSLDTFCPLGPAILHRSSLPFPPELDIRMELNGKEMQHSNTGNLIHSIAELIADFSAGRTLLPGDIILTGTPSGVGLGRNPKVVLNPGDEMAVTIEHLGTLKNPVV
ncbi:MAG: fumarylacetoacetate hydrolase family protein [Eubacteriaceae bacterium]|jgi:2-keto-4-pentenoate hydratase/2-oxohepta-3-ene-1,7-dioic acid hydratase in catechol pathway